MMPGMEVEYSAELVPDGLVLLVVRIFIRGRAYFAQGSERVDDVERSHFSLALERLEELKAMAWLQWANEQRVEAKTFVGEAPTHDDLFLRARMELVAGREEPNAPEISRSAPARPSSLALAPRGETGSGHVQLPKKLIQHFFLSVLSSPYFSSRFWPDDWRSVGAAVFESGWGAVECELGERQRRSLERQASTPLTMQKRRSLQ